MNCPRCLRDVPAGFEHRSEDDGPCYIVRRDPLQSVPEVASRPREVWRIILRGRPRVTHFRSIVFRDGVFTCTDPVDWNPHGPPTDATDRPNVILYPATRVESVAVVWPEAGGGDE